MLIERPRLTAHLKRASLWPVTLVVAGSGYGKTVAIRQYLAGFDGQHIYFRVRPRTQSLVSFLRDFTAELEPTLPGPHQSFALAYERAAQSRTPVELLADWLLEHMKELNATICIDDLQYAEDPQVTNLLANLVDRSPPNLRWIIATYSATGLPVMQWMARNVATNPLTESDFALTPDEAERFVGGVSAEFVAELQRFTKGMPAAFALGADLGRRGLFAIGDLSASAKPYEALAERFYTTLPSESRAALRAVCVLRELSPAIAEHLSEQEIVAEVRRLAAEHPVAELTVNQSIVFDDLFKGFLRRTLVRDPEEYLERATTAARACERSGLLTEAIELYREAGRLDGIAKILERHGLTEVERGNVHDIKVALEELPATLRDHSPKLTAIRALLEVRVGHADTAEAWFRTAISLAEGDEKAEMTYRYASYLMQLRPSDCIELLEPLLQKALKPELEASVCSALAVAYTVQRSKEKSFAMVDRSIALVESLESQLVCAKTFYTSAWCSWSFGDVRKAEQWSALSVAVAERYGFYDLASRVYSMMHALAYQVGENVQFANTLRLKISASTMKAVGDERTRLWTLLAGYFCAVEADDRAALSAFDQLLMARDMSGDVDNMRVKIAPAKALRVAWSGDFETAAETMQLFAPKQESADRRAAAFADCALYAACAGNEKAARSALVESHLEEAEIAAANVYTRGAALSRSLALMELGDWSTVDEELAGLDDAPPDGRTDLIRRAILVLRDMWREEVNPTLCDAVLEELRQAGLGGIALLLEALPIPTKARTTSSAVVSL